MDAIVRVNPCEIVSRKMHVEYTYIDILTSRVDNWSLVNLLIELSIGYEKHPLLLCTYSLYVAGFCKSSHTRNYVMDLPNWPYTHTMAKIFCHYFIAP